ncbi:MAG: hypothetical protein JXB62_14305 [Pirellulales bacterium]|nr:hypothetical protein [Pirellulales bacterium]
MAIPLAVLFGFAIAAGIAAWVLEPINRAGRQRHAPLQFMLVDYLCLFVLFQLALALVHAFPSGQFTEVAGRLFAYGAAWFAFGVMWWLSVQTLSRAGVRNAWRRAVFLACIVPLTVFASLAAVASSVSPVVAAHMAFVAGRASAWTPGILLTIAVASFLILWGCRCLTKWVVAAPAILNAETPAPGPPDDT